MSNNRLLGSITGFFGDIGRARAASDLYTNLSHLSDEGLKARGLNRDDLPRYAFEKAFGRR